MTATITNSGKHRKRCEISMCRNTATYRIGHPTHFNTGILICEDCLSGIMNSIADDEQLTIKMLKNFDGSEEVSTDGLGVVKGDDCEECKYYLAGEAITIKDEFLEAMANSDYKLGLAQMQSLIKGYHEKTGTEFEFAGNETKAVLFEMIKGMI